MIPRELSLQLGSDWLTVMSSLSVIKEVPDNEEENAGQDPEGVGQRSQVKGLHSKL